MHGRDVVVTMVTGTPVQRAMVQEALDRWWGPLMQMHGPRSTAREDRDLHWRIKARTSEELRQEFLVDLRAADLELGLTIPDPELRYDEAAGEWRYSEPDWNELRTVVTNHGPKSQARLEFRRLESRGDALGPEGGPGRGAPRSRSPEPARPRASRPIPIWSRC